MSAHEPCKVPYSVCLDPRDIEAIESIAKERDIPARTFLRQLILRSLREERGIRVRNGILPKVECPLQGQEGAGRGGEA